MVCPKCRNTVADDGNFCSRCGTDLVKRSAMRKRLVAPIVFIVIFALLSSLCVLLPYYNATPDLAENLAKDPNTIVEEETELTKQDVIVFTLFDYIELASAQKLDIESYVVIVLMIAGVVAALLAIFRRPVYVIGLSVVVLFLNFIMRTGIEDTYKDFLDFYEYGIFHIFYPYTMLMVGAGGVWQYIVMRRIAKDEIHAEENVALPLSSLIKHKLAFPMAMVMALSVLSCACYFLPYYVATPEYAAELATDYEATVDEDTELTAREAVFFELKDYVKLAASEKIDIESYVASGVLVFGLIAFFFAMRTRPFYALASAVIPFLVVLLMRTGIEDTYKKMLEGYEPGIFHIVYPIVTALIVCFAIWGMIAAYTTKRSCKMGVYAKK